MRRSTWIAALLAAVAATAAMGQERKQRARRRRAYPPVLAGASKVEVYKTVGEVRLNMYVYMPEGVVAGTGRPAIVFFFGGGFVSGSPRQFERHCQYFCSRGMVAMTADYRVKTRHGTGPLDAVRDGKSAIRWVRRNAEKLGVDPERIVASGGSAGGLIAACCGLVPGLDEPSEDTSISSVPNALVLFNPAIMGKSVPQRVARRFTKQIMPFYHVRDGLPPMIMFFGTADRLLEGARQFRDAAVAKGNRCELLTWEGVGHGFFNYGRSGNRYYVETVRAADKFLVSLGYLSGEPTIGSAP